MTDTLLRQWTMLAHVPRAPRKIDTATLQAHLGAQGYDIDQRSVQRDLRKLSAVFPLMCDEVHRPHGWSWSRMAEVFSVPGVDVHTALAFHMADEHLQHLLPEATREYLRPWFAQARRLLDEASSNRVARWPDKVRVVAPGQPLVPAVVAPETLEAVHLALAGERQMQVRYRRRGELEVREYTVHPLGLVYRDAMAILVCTLFNYRDAMQLLLHRIEEATVLDATVQAPDGFDLDAWIASRAFDFRVSDGHIALECLFEPFAAVRVLETPLAPDQQTTTLPDGKVLLRAQVPDTMQLRHWLRGFGQFLEVLGPPDLRAEMAEHAARMAERYRPDAKSSPAD